MKHNIIKTDNYLLVVDESEIKEGDFLWSFSNTRIVVAVKSTELYIHSKKIIAHLPLNGSPILEGVDLLPALQEDDNSLGTPLVQYIFEKHNQDRVMGFCDGYNKAKEKYKYTEEDIDKAYWAGMQFVGEDKGSYKEFIQSLSKPKMPVRFECELVNIMGKGEPITERNSQGHTQWVGTYIYE